MSEYDTFPCGGSVTGHASRLKQCVVSCELLEFAVCQHTQGVLGESAQLQELPSVFQSRSCLFLGVRDVTYGSDNVDGSGALTTSCKTQAWWHPAVRTAGGNCCKKQIVTGACSTGAS